jgi:hypothetical protein
MATSEVKSEVRTDSSEIDGEMYSAGDGVTVSKGRSVID